MKISAESHNASQMMIVDPKTCLQFKDRVIEANVYDCSILCYDVMTVWDVDTEENVEVIAKEKDQNYDGPGVRYKIKMYKRFCDFDVVDRNTGAVLAEARYMNVTSRI